MSKYKLLRGFKDLLPLEYKQYSYLKKEIEETANLYGYKFTNSSILEDSNLYQDVYGDINGNMFNISSRFTNKASLNYDSTVSILRSVVENKLYVDKSLPLKLMYLKEVYKYDKKYKDKSSKYELGFECVGDKSVYLDVESVLLIMKILNNLGLVNYNLRINNLNESNEYYNTYKQTLTNLGIDFEEDKDIKGKIYSTGICFEVDIDECIGIIKGSRYDDLINVIGGVNICSNGISVDYDDLVKLMISNELFPDFNEEIDFYIIPKNEKVFKYALYVSELLRDMGAVVEIHYKEYDLKRLDDLLGRIDVCYSLIIDDEDERKETLKVRNGFSNEENVVKLKDFIKDLQNLEEEHEGE